MVKAATRLYRRVSQSQAFAPALLHVPTSCELRAAAGHADQTVAIGRLASHGGPSASGYALFRGMATVKIVPCFSVEVTDITPPWAVATSLAMNRPRPMLVLWRPVSPFACAS